MVIIFNIKSIHKTIKIIIQEPVKLIGEGEYNLNILTEIKVTESYLGLDQETRECQNKEPFYNCTTRAYLDNVLKECGCLPANILLSNRDPPCPPNKLKCVENIELDLSNYDCMPPCSGLIVTGFTKSEKIKDLDKLFPVFDAYNNYKIVTEHPSGYKGKYEIHMHITKIY